MGVHEAVAEALGKMGDAHAVEPLISALKDRAMGVHEAVAEALGKMGDARAVKPLVSALKDEDSSVREAAAEALGKMGDARAVEPLISAVWDEDRIGKTAAEALGKMGDARAVKPLVIVLKHEDSRVRHWAAKALGEIGDARAVEPLISVINDSAVADQWVLPPMGIMNALCRIIEKSAVEINMDCLLRIAQLPRKASYLKFGMVAACGYSLTSREILDCSQLIQLARQELIRRGVEA